jgi:hypothetical protein
MFYITETDARVTRGSPYRQNGGLARTLSNFLSRIYAVLMSSLLCEEDQRGGRIVLQGVVVNVLTS